MNTHLLVLSILPFIGVGLLVFVIAAAFVVGIVRNRRFQQKQDLHEGFAKSAQLNIAYQSPQQYRAYGKYRGYNLTVAPEELLRTQDQAIKFINKVSIPMINPNRKCIRISLPTSPLASQIPTDGAMKVKHNAQTWLDIYTNDMMFSSLLLSEDVKISIGAFFQSDGKDCVIYIQDDELACLFPGLLLNNHQANTYKKAMDILCDIKDELN